MALNMFFHALLMSILVYNILYEQKQIHTLDISFEHNQKVWNTEKQQQQYSNLA